MITNIVLVAGLISVVSFTGALIIGDKSNNWFFKNSHLLVVFAAGVFAVTSLNLMSEAFEFLSNQTAVLTIMVGFIGILVLHKILPETHHHHDKDCGTCVTQKSGTKILVGDFIHNIADGIVLVAAFTISKEIGLVVAFSILIHEIIQEIGEYIVLRNAGFSQTKTLLYNFFSSLSIFVGVAIGIFLTQNVELQAVLLGISAGAFLHIVFHDLLPYDKIRKVRSRDSWNYISVFLLGITIMVGIGFLTPHTHSHEDSEKNEDHEYGGEIHHDHNYSEAIEHESHHDK